MMHLVEKIENNKLCLMEVSINHINYQAKRKVQHPISFLSERNISEGPEYENKSTLG